MLNQIGAVAKDATRVSYNRTPRGHFWRRPNSFVDLGQEVKLALLKRGRRSERSVFSTANEPAGPENVQNGDYALRNETRSAARNWSVERRIRQLTPALSNIRSGRHHNPPAPFVSWSDDDILGPPESREFIALGRRQVI